MQTGPAAQGDRSSKPSTRTNRWGKSTQALLCRWGKQRGNQKRIIENREIDKGDCTQRPISESSPADG